MTIDSIPPANPRRGLPNEHLAVRFAQQYPIGTILLVNAFDSWCAGQGLFTVPQTTDKKADAWLAHLQRRHQIKAGLNRALVHPRMRSVGLEACSIERARNGVFEVRSAKDGVLHNTMARDIESLTVTRRKQLQYTMQSADWNALPAYERVRVEMLYFDIEAFGESTQYAAGQLKRKTQQVIEAMNQAVQSGLLSANSPTAQALLNPPPDEDDDEADNDDTGNDD